MKNLIALIAFLTVSGFVCSLSGQEVASPPKALFTQAPPQKTQVFGGDGFRATVQPFLKKHCIDCHGEDEQNAGMRVDRLPAGFAAEDAVLWTRVYRAIESGKMPPGKNDQPLAVDKKAVNDWILDQSHAVRSADGSGSQRRLNRREYAALITSVLKLDLPQFEKYLPGDRLIDGFDTLASGLQDATASVNAAQEAIDLLLRRVDFLEPKAGPPQGLFVDFLAGKSHFVGPWSERNLKVRGGREKIIEPHFVNPSFHNHRRGKGLDITVNYDQADFDGFLRLRCTVASLAPKGVAPPTLRFSAGTPLEITGDADHPRTVEFLILPSDQVPVVENREGMPPRYHYSFYFVNQQTLPFDPLSAPDSRGVVTQPKEYSEAVKGKDTTYPVSWLQFQKCEVEPAYRQQWLTAEDRGGLSADDAGAMTVVRKLASGAFRRPISSAEDHWLASFYQKCRKEGRGLDDSIRLTTEMILTSAPARTLLPTDVSDPVLRQYAIASRLAFGLLCQPPDSRLLGLAASGKLSDPSVLHREIDRLLDHPESMNGFLMPFATMWLALDQPKVLAPELAVDGKEAKPQRATWFQYREHILTGMDRETAAYFGMMLKENLPARELLDSDWLPMNDAMAFHYDYPRIIGHEFQKVKLRPDDPRGGGILGQAGVMSMTTWMGPNWPIYRGAWSLRHVLNHPPPPPPLEVPELNPQDYTGQPLRVKIAAHTKEAKCAVCHKSIDPVGFAFQNFDVSGRWRGIEAEVNQVSTNGEGVTRYEQRGKMWPVDASGSLPRGEEFKTWKEFKQLAAAHYSEDLARGQLQRYVRYFASREPTVLDEIVLVKLLESHGARQFPMRDMLKDFLTSEIFLGRKN